MDLKIDFQSDIPLHLQAEKLLRELISTMDPREGKLLPGEVELSQRLGISRNTLRQAINKLVYEGLLIRKKGYGTTVAGKSISGRVKNWFSFSGEMKAMGIEVVNFEFHLGYKVPAPEVSAFFQSGPEEKVLTLERLRGRENFPFVYFISCFNPSLNLSVDNDFSQPLYDMLEKKYGIKALLSQEEISAVKAPSNICRKLGISGDDPVLFRKRFVYDINHTPVEYNLGYYRGDSFVIHMESERK